MYSQQAWGGPVDPFILIKFLPYTGGQDPVVSLVIFEWKDEDLIGVYPTAESTQKAGICEKQYVEAGFCEEADIGKFILSPNATDKSKSFVLTQAVHLNNSQPIKYDIKNTGYYCVLTDKFTAADYTAVVEFRNAYGELPATQIPKLPFYGGITMLYALVAVFWGFLYYQHHSDICKKAPNPLAARVTETNKCISGGSELHNSNPDLPCGGDVDDMGILWYVMLPALPGKLCWLTQNTRLLEPKRLQYRRQSFTRNRWSSERGSEFVLFLLAAHRVHGLWSRQAHAWSHHDLRTMARYSPLCFWPGVRHHEPCHHS